MRALSGRLHADLWVFAYGSLMWDPAIYIAEIRTAALAGFHRAFCLKTHIGRGSLERPGLMVGLHDGGECQGLALRIPANIVDRETDIMWMREMVSDGYAPTFVRVQTPQGTVEALTFVADKGSSRWVDLDEEATARMIATGVGMLGTNLDYLDTLAGHPVLLGVIDIGISHLHARAHQVVGALAIGPQLPRPSSTLPKRPSG